MNPEINPRPEPEVSPRPEFAREAIALLGPHITPEDDQWRSERIEQFCSQLGISNDPVLIICENATVPNAPASLVEFLQGYSQELRAFPGELPQIDFQTELLGAALSPVAEDFLRSVYEGATDHFIQQRSQNSRLV